MQTDYLRYFVDVATLGSLSAAAKKNFMTPQGVGRSIASLETELGCELLKRDSNKVTLTRFGERLLQQALQMLECENDMRRVLGDLQVEEQGLRDTRFICFLSPLFFETSLFFPASGLATAHYERVQFLQRNTPDAVTELIDADRRFGPKTIVAAGLCFFDSFEGENAAAIERLHDAGYEYRPFMSTRDYVLVPAYSTLASKIALNRDDVRSLPLAVSSGKMAERAVCEYVGTDNIAVSTSDSSYRGRLCRMGEALTFVPGSSLAFGVPEGTTAVYLEDSYAIEVGFAARSSVLREGLLADLIGRLRAFYETNTVERAFELLGDDAGV